MIDKLLHFLVTLTIVLLGALYGHLVSGIVIAVFLSFLKELVDQIRYKGWSWNDLIADGIGILAGVAAVCIKAIAEGV